MDNFCPFFIYKTIPVISNSEAPEFFLFLSISAKEGHLPSRLQMAFEDMEIGKIVWGSRI